MALLATTLLAACSKVPDGILSEKKMQGVLMDMLLAEAMVNVDYNTYKSDTMKLALYESVFRKHDITQAVYHLGPRLNVPPAYKPFCYSIPRHARPARNYCPRNNSFPDVYRKSPH